MSARFKLDGGMIPRTVKRMMDERTEERFPADSSTAAMTLRGRRHVVRLINISGAGAMVIFPHTPNIGEKLPLQLLDQGVVTAQVRWVKDGKIGLSFAIPPQ